MEVGAQGAVCKIQAPPAHLCGGKDAAFFFGRLLDLVLRAQADVVEPTGGKRREGGAEGRGMGLAKAVCVCYLLFHLQIPPVPSPLSTPSQSPLHCRIARAHVFVQSLPSPSTTPPSSPPAHPPPPPTHSRLHAPTPPPPPFSALATPLPILFALSRACACVLTLACVWVRERERRSFRLSPFPLDSLCVVRIIPQLIPQPLQHPHQRLIPHRMHKRSAGFASFLQ